MSQSESSSDSWPPGKRTGALRRVHRIGPETDRLILRALTIDDAQAFFDLNSNPDVMRLTGEPRLESLEPISKLFCL